jgi:hypothetical protein
LRSAAAVTLPAWPKASQAIGCTLLAMGLGALAVAAWRAGHPPLPAEYATLRAVMGRLAQHNSLGQNPIGFSINNGSYAASLAQMRGFCKEENCDFYAQLNPYKNYSKDWDEISRQSYTLGDVEGWSTANGSIEIPRAAFRIYGRRSGWLACTVAHEIAHIQRHHLFTASYYANNTIRLASAQKQEQLNYVKSRQQELEADRDAAVIMARAGYGGRICLDALNFAHKSSGDGSATEPNSTHPGYDDRIKAITKFYAHLEKHPPAKTSSTPGQFHYSPADNLLSFTPSQN